MLQQNAKAFAFSEPVGTQPLTSAFSALFFEKKEGAKSDFVIGGAKSARFL